MHAVVFCGIQGSGKSTFYRDRFADTHVRLNLDMLRTRNREDVLLHACLAVQQPFVADNTNPTAKARGRYLRLARAAGYETVELYWFDVPVEDAVARNAARPAAVREVAVRGTFAKLERPTAAEGFDHVYAVRVVDGRFEVETFSAGPT